MNWKRKGARVREEKCKKKKKRLVFENKKWEWKLRKIKKHSVGEYENGEWRCKVVGFFFFFIQHTPCPGMFDNLKKKKKQLGHTCNRVPCVPHIQYIFSARVRHANFCVQTNTRAEGKPCPPSLSPLKKKKNWNTKN